MLRILAWICGGLVLALALAVAAFLLFRAELVAFYLDPGKPFEAAPPPPAPDYETAQAWAALPGRRDTADLAPAGVAPPADETGAPVDVFFIHPTTYLSPESWNAPIDNARARAVVDRAVMPVQAGAFNHAGRVYAPYYRQATLFAFMEDWQADPAGPEGTDGAKALALAYGDVARAFETYVRLYNQGRPFILAAHSQGALHLIRLLQDYLRAPELRARLVAAYAVGMSAPRALFEGADAPLAHVPPCRRGDDTGCFIVWNSFGPNGDPRLWFEQQRVWEGGRLRPVAGRPLTCTSPAAWTPEGAGGTPVPQLALPFPDPLDGAPLKALPDPVLLTLGAACRQGILYLDRMPPAPFKALVFENEDLHVYDYNLFYGAVRANAAARAQALLGARAGR